MTEKTFEVADFRVASVPRTVSMLISGTDGIDYDITITREQALLLATNILDLFQQEIQAPAS